MCNKRYLIIFLSIFAATPAQASVPSDTFVVTGEAAGGFYLTEREPAKALYSRLIFCPENTPFISHANRFITYSASNARVTDIPTEPGSAPSYLTRLCPR